MDQVVTECHCSVQCAQIVEFMQYHLLAESYLFCRDPPGSEQLPCVQRLQLSVQGLGQWFSWVWIVI